MSDAQTNANQSLLLTAFSWFIEWGNRYLTLSSWFLRKGGRIFVKLEILMFFVTAFCISSLFWIDRIHTVVAIFISIFLAQRLLEFFLVYTRNFILHRGRIFSEFSDDMIRGQWLLLIFSLNIIQILFVFATWYYLLNLHDNSAFTQVLNQLDSLYFSVMTFLTVGYGDIVPIDPLAKILVILQSAVTFFTLVVVINGLISMHFSKR